MVVGVTKTIATVLRAAAPASQKARDRRNSSVLLVASFVFWLCCRGSAVALPEAHVGVACISTVNFGRAVQSFGSDSTVLAKQEQAASKAAQQDSS